MPKLFAFVFLLFSLTICLAQQKLDKLTVEKIMRDPKWIGTSPSNVYWSADGNSFILIGTPTIYLLTRFILLHLLIIILLKLRLNKNKI